MLPTGLRARRFVVDASDAEIASVTGRVPSTCCSFIGPGDAAPLAEIRGRFGLPVMKAIRVATADDLKPLTDYEAVSDWILFDAKPPRNVTSLPGGTGIAFDWQLLRNVTVKKPWMLSGGLTADNLAEGGIAHRSEDGRCLVRGRGSAGHQERRTHSGIFWRLPRVSRPGADPKLAQRPLCAINGPVTAVQSGSLKAKARNSRLPSRQEGPAGKLRSHV